LYHVLLSWRRFAFWVIEIYYGSGAAPLRRCARTGGSKPTIPDEPAFKGGKIFVIAVKMGHSAFEGLPYEPCACISRNPARQIL
jgi:hypothetical protein